MYPQCLYWISGIMKQRSRAADVKPEKWYVIYECRHIVHYNTPLLQQYISIVTLGSRFRNVRVPHDLEA
jgi:hypothetical protein